MDRKISALLEQDGDDHVFLLQELDLPFTQRIAKERNKLLQRLEKIYKAEKEKKNEHVSSISLGGKFISAPNLAFT